MYLYYSGGRIEVHDLHPVSLSAPFPPEKVVSVLAVDDCRQRVTDIVVEGVSLSCSERSATGRCSRSSCRVAGTLLDR